MSSALETLLISFIGGVAAAITAHIFSIISDKTSRNRKIFDDLFSELERLVAESVDIASTVWSNAGGKNAPLEQELTCKIHDVSTILSFFNAKGSKLELRVSPAFGNFRRAMTGDDFGVSKRAAEPSRVVLIRSTAIAFRIALKDAQYESNRLVSGQ